MKDELMITTRLTRRMFHKLISRLEDDRNRAIINGEADKDQENEFAKRRYNEACNDVHDIDLLLEALYEED